MGHSARPPRDDAPTRGHLPRPFYARPADFVARALLGCMLVSERDGILTGGRIVETEAYLGADDPASHAARLRRGGVAAMFGGVGIAYVYRAYGIHAMLNAVAHDHGGVGAVLVRAIEPRWGLEEMQRRRGVVHPYALCSGPGRLCQALAIRLTDHGHDLTTGPPLWIEPADDPGIVLVGGRIGISRGGEAPLRFFLADNRFVSAHRRGSVVDPTLD